MASPEVIAYVDYLESLWVLALYRKEWFRDAKATRARLEQMRADAYAQKQPIAG